MKQPPLINSTESHSHSHSHSRSQAKQEGSMPVITDSSMPIMGMLQVVCAGICWGTLGIFSTYLGQIGFSGWQISILRVLTAGALLLLLLPSLLPSIKVLNRRQWFVLSLQSVIGVLGMTVCFFFAVIYSGVAMAVALLYTAPVFSLIFAHFLLGEKMTRQSSLLSFLAVFGVLLTMVETQDLAQSNTGFWLNIGVLIGLLSGVCYSMLGILGKKVMQESELTNASHLVFFTSVIISAFALLFVPQTYSTYAMLFELPLKAWGYVLGISALGTIVPFFLYMSALSKLPATRASVFTIFEPLTAIFLSVGLLQQHLSLLQGLGIALIILSALLNAVLAK